MGWADTVGLLTDATYCFYNVLVKKIVPMRNFKNFFGNCDRPRHTCLL